MMPERIQPLSDKRYAPLARRAVVRLVVAIFAFVTGNFTGSATASENGLGFVFFCPAYWPGLDITGTPLDDRVRDWTPTVWGDYLSRLFYNSDDTLQSDQSGEVIQLDCRYKRDRHITIVVMGSSEIVNCKRTRHPDAPKVKTLVCETRAKNSVPGPIIIQPAEPVTADTAIRGFKVRQSPEAIEAAGRKLGYTQSTTTAEHGAPTEMFFTGDGERLTVGFDQGSGLSRRVELIKLRRHEVDGDFWESMIVRFGLHRDFPATNPLTERWASPDGKITAELKPRRPEYDSLVLTDLAAGSGATVPPRGEKREKLGFLVACPTHWPGLDKPGSPLDDRPGDSAAKVRTAEGALVDGDRFTARGQAPVHLDCRYLGDRHLSVLVPGDDIACRRTRHPDAAKVTTVVCQTRAETGMPGPIVIQPADKGSD